MPTVTTLRWILGVGLLALAFGAGWKVQGWKYEARLAEGLRLHNDLMAAERKRGDQLATDLETERKNIKTVTIDVIKEVPKYTTVYVERPGDAPKPIPPAVITWGAVGLLDRSNRPDLPATASEFAYPPGVTGITRSPASLGDIIGAGVENNARHAECRAQLNSLIDWHLGQTQP